MTAHTAVVFTQYMMLTLESRESNDNRSLGELFLYFSDEKINELANAFFISIAYDYGLAGAYFRNSSR